MQAYSDPKRASDPHALPDIEVWSDRDVEITCACGVYTVAYDRAFATDTVSCPSCEDEAEESKILDSYSWWWWSCLPGCMPDSDPMGPFATEAEALADAQEGQEE
jgi:hypothetical protein